jgi:hypothetical protein
MSSLSSLIHELSESGMIYTEPDISGFVCKCGSIVQKRYLRKHLTSRKHLIYEQRKNRVEGVGDDLKVDNELDNELDNECGICYMEKSNHYTCTVCKNKHCTECHAHIDKCPFCRTVFPIQYTNAEKMFIEILEIYYSNVIQCRDLEFRRMHLYRICHYACIDNIIHLRKPHFKSIKRSLTNLIRDEYYSSRFYFSSFFLDLLNEY